MRVAVVKNMERSPLGQVGVALDEADADVVTFRPYRDGRLPDDHAAFDALVVLGGEQSALDDARYPALPAIAALMRRYAEAEKAVLGICLGSQILARAFGGTNRLGVAREFGWRPIAATLAGKADPVLGAVGDTFPIFQWHSDTFTLPAGAELLASGTEVPHQAYRIGAKAYGTQFHFEASTVVVDDWSRAFEEAAEAMQPGWRHARSALARNLGPAADAAGLALARAWVALV
ncbi:MAG: type 1 glutamine amidotransferase [Rhodobacteraceae bacterium]|nr:type 1 glutamine amidotransferase [Paracoccaceae bacterium]